MQHKPPDTAAQLVRSVVDRLIATRETHADAPEIPMPTATVESLTQHLVHALLLLEVANDDLLLGGLAPGWVWVLVAAVSLLLVGLGLWRFWAC